ncbi:hypothetical protein WJX75_009851 [Coccomyxa subellipsoidea]|uniref:Biotin-protein ligase N-terminal domain-containing protein n=1 Tax=Coccomyxa subellipsoidea TaxID=248742 RepID=A0ABR2YWN4_9CHLO
MHPDHRIRTVLVYDGEGAGSRSVVSAVESLRNSLSPQVQVQQLGPEKLLSGTWQDGCLMLVMPGGADLPYCRQLNGHGNSLIRGFVEAGGAYLGLCAGAYYACSYVYFALGTKLEVKGARELAFFLGVAAGPVYAGFRYESENGAHAARVAFRPPQPAASGNSATATNGHGAPQKTPSEGTSRAAASAAEPGAGWLTCRDYTNGGPQFVPYAVSGADGSGTPGHGGTVECARPGFERLAVYPDKGNGLAAAAGMGLYLADEPSRTMLL